MKRIKLRGLLFALGIGLFFEFMGGCTQKIELGNNFLEKAPGVDVTIDTIFSKAEDAERVLNAVYKTTRYGWIYEFSNKGNRLQADHLFSLTDLSQSFRPDGAVIQYYYSGLYDASTESHGSSTKYSLWFGEDAYKGIRLGYILLDNIDKVPELSDQRKNRMKAEARTIMAMNYSDIYRNFGGMPWLSDYFRSTDEIESYPRLTSLAMVDSIVNLLDKAIPDLPWVLSDSETESGRVTKASAMGLKARILLFAASPLFNNDQPFLEGEASDSGYTWHNGYDPNLWKRAADAANDLINEIEVSGGYQLVNTGEPRKDFRHAYFDRTSTELLISTRVQFRNDGDYTYLGNDVFIGHGVACPTQEYVDMFPMSDGVPISESEKYDLDNPYLNRDPRLYETVLINGDEYQGRTVQTYIGGLERVNPSDNRNATGYGPRKFVLDNDNSTSRNAIVQWPYLRLPEIYLTYSEALNEFNDGPTPDAYKYVNLVRNRVGLDNLEPNLTKEQFREAVLNERALEFGYEEVRWFDLIRWKRENDFKKKLHGMNIRKEGNGFSYERFELPTRYWQDNFSPKWYLSAILPDEINKGYGLVQNPGW